MKPIKEESLMDYKARIIESKKRYIIEVKEFRQRVLEEKRKKEVGREKVPVREQYPTNPPA